VTNSETRRNVDDAQEIIDEVLRIETNREYNEPIFRMGWSGGRLRKLSEDLSMKVGFIVVVCVSGGSLYGYALPIPFSTSAKPSNEVVIGTCGDGAIAVRPCP